MFGWLRRRIRGQVQQAVHLVDVGVHEPRALPGMLRSALISVWGARGGGLFGLGYAVTFVVLEIRTLIGNAAELVGSGQGVMAEMLSYLLRLGYESLLNMLFAFIWPALAVQWGGSAMFWALVLAFIVFEWGVRPLVERRIPELRRQPKRKRKRGGDADERPTQDPEASHGETDPAQLTLKEPNKREST
ncbi:MAG: hypothetical protein AAF515_22620 [Pseudomonadota bacterium]